jgi:hypothetical protein
MRYDADFDDHCGGNAGSDVRWTMRSHYVRVVRRRAVRAQGRLVAVHVEFYHARELSDVSSH